MNVLNSLRGIDGVKDELAALQEKRRELRIKHATMLRTPRYDSEYSSAKLDTWSRELEKMDAQEQELLEKLAALRSEPKYLAAKEAKLTEIRSKLAALRSELYDANAEYEQLRRTAAYTLLDGEEPLELAGKMRLVKEQAELLVSAVECTLDAYRLGSAE